MKRLLLSVYFHKIPLNMHEATKDKIQEIKGKPLFPFSLPFTFTISITNTVFIVNSLNSTFLPYPWHIAMIYVSVLVGRLITLSLVFILMKIVGIEEGCIYKKIYSNKVGIHKNACNIFETS